MRIIIATDSFKGCMSATEAGKAMEGALKGIMPERILRHAEKKDNH